MPKVWVRSILELWGCGGEGEIEGTKARDAMLPFVSVKQQLARVCLRTYFGGLVRLLVGPF